MANKASLTDAEYAVAKRLCQVLVRQTSLKLSMAENAELKDKAEQIDRVVSTVRDLAFEQIARCRATELLIQSGKENDDAMYDRLRKEISRALSCGALGEYPSTVFCDALARAGLDDGSDPLMLYAEQLLVFAVGLQVVAWALRSRMEQASGKRGRKPETAWKTCVRDAQAAGIQPTQLARVAASSQWLNPDGIDCKNDDERDRLAALLSDRFDKHLADIRGKNLR